MSLAICLEKIKRLTLFSIAIGLTVGFVTWGCIVIQDQPTVDSELQRLIYPGSHEIVQEFKSNEAYDGRWRTSDSINTVSEFYNKMRFYTLAPENNTETEGTQVMNLNLDENAATSPYIQLIAEQNGTIIDIYIKLDDPDVLSSFASTLKRLGYKLQMLGR